MARAVAQACLAGAASAALHASGLLGVWAAVTLGFLAPLPIALVSLSRHGELGSLALGVAALGALLLSGSGLAALSYIAVIGLPCWAFARLAVRSTASGGWPALGPLIVGASALGLGLVAAFVLAIWASAGGQAEAAMQSLLSQLQTGFTAGGTAELSAAGEAALKQVIRILPGALVVSWLLMQAANCALAQALLTSQGGEARSTPRLRDLTLPRWLAAGAAGAVLLAGFAPDPLGLLGANLALVAALPLALLGLSVVHVFAYRRDNPRIWLIVAYALIIVLGWPILLVGALGFVEPWLGIRRRLGVEPSE